MNKTENEKIARMRDLIFLLEKANYSYEQENISIMSDLEYDSLAAELEILEKELGSNNKSVNKKVGCRVSNGLRKKEHKYPILSLDKTKEINQLMSFLGDEQGLLSYKLDGLTIVITYNNGELVEAVTRGNGSVGEDITENAKTFTNLPLKIKYKRKITLRGEAIITNSNFERINSNESNIYKNPRNLCSGSVRQLDPAVTASRCVDFVCFSLVSSEDSFSLKSEEFSFLREQGFAVVETEKVDKNNLKNAVEKLTNEIKNKDFQADGLVLTFNDTELSKTLGVTSKFPKDSLAYKWRDSQKETILRSIEWKTSRSGKINPVAVFDAVELEGSTVTRASVHNLSIIKELKLGKNDKITVFKANMIIPQIAKNLTQSGPMLFPEECSRCGGKTVIKREKEVETLHCDNPECPEKKLQQLVHFVSREAMNIEGLSESTLEKLDLADVSDIYKIENYKEKIVKIKGLGDKMYSNLLKSIENSRKIPVFRFITALGIPLIGVENAKLICKFFKNDFVSISEATVEELQKIEGIGYATAKEFRDFFENPAKKQLVEKLLAEVEFEQKTEAKTQKNTKIEGKTFVITGKTLIFENRASLKEAIESRGGKINSSVNNKTDFLINNDLEAESSKNIKAKELAIPIISEDFFVKEFLNNKNKGVSQMYFSMHNHSEFSFLDGFSNVTEYMEQAAKIGLKGLVLTEHGNAFSAPYIHKLQEKYPEVKIGYGCEFYEAIDPTSKAVFSKDPYNKNFHILVVAKNDKGRKFINKLITVSNFPENTYYKPRISLEMLAAGGENIIVSTACLGSKLSFEEDFDTCVDYVLEYKKVLPHFYLELQSHSSQKQADYNKKLLRLAEKTNTKFIITTDSHAASIEDLDYQKYHIINNNKSDNLEEIYEGCYLQTPEEIHQIMDSQIGAEKVNEGLEETLKILDLIDFPATQMIFKDPILPSFPVPKNTTNAEYITELVNENFDRLFLNGKFTEEQIQIRRDRIEQELAVINKMDYAGYFLIVHDVIKNCSKLGVTFGKGRGSSGGSLVCYCLDIIKVDPVEHNLIFERFLNEERIGLPDIDTDCYPKDIVAKYLREKYGFYNIAQIANIIRFTPTTSLENTIKTFNKDQKWLEEYKSPIQYTTIELIKSVVNNSSSWEENLNSINSVIPGFIENPCYADIIRIAGKINGRAKTVGKHAGGIVISDTDLANYCAAGADSGANKTNVFIIQVDKDVCESLGLVKFDFLGLLTLSILTETKKMSKVDDDFFHLTNDKFTKDPKTFELLGRGDTYGLFQVSESEVTKIMKSIKPGSLSDLCAIVALYRPDTKDLIETFIENKKDPSKIKYIHPDMEEILGSTYGCMIYQEQVMQIVRKFGGLSYGQADIFRKAIGKKKLDLIREQSEILKGEIVKNGYTEEIAAIISEDLAKKGGYMFNLSHALVYAATTLETAYLKANYPVSFFCSIINSGGDTSEESTSVNKDKIPSCIAICKQQNIPVLPPDINESQVNFSVFENKSIRFGLGAINGIGESSAKKIINERESNGKYTSLLNFIDRVSMSPADVIKMLKVDSIKTPDTLKMLENYYSYLAGLSSRRITPAALKNEDLYSEELANLEKNKEEFIKNEKKKEGSVSSDLWDLEFLSVSLGGGITRYKNTVSKYRDFAIAQNSEISHVVGKIVKVKNGLTKKGDPYCLMDVLHESQLVKIVAWSPISVKYKELFKKNSELLIFKGFKKENQLTINQVCTAREALEYNKTTGKKVLA